MKLSRIGVLALVICALTAGAAVADEHVDGKYRGHTDGSFFTRNSQGEGHYRRAKVTFIATDTRITHIRFEVRVTAVLPVDMLLVRGRDAYRRHRDDKGNYSNTAELHGLIPSHRWWGLGYP